MLPDADTNARQRWLRAKVAHMPMHDGVCEAADADYEGDVVVKAPLTTDVTATAAVAMHTQTATAAEMVKQSFSRNMDGTQAPLRAACADAGDEAVVLAPG